jgi:glycine betaine/proline transport system substrate-binding protein|tara:strand:- start:171 stop:2330 length:2160 start_codon:yes stop_codon:yes gene_type:complete
MKFYRKIFILSLFAKLIIFSTTNANAACKVHLGDFDWDSANVHTAITSLILTEGYGCEVQVTKGSTTPIMHALFDQQIDVITEVWRDNLISMIETNVSKGNIVELGVNTPKSGQGFYVDRATAQKYNLNHIDDLRRPGIAKLFNNRLVSCISGWTCYTINFVKLKVYDLDRYYTNYDPGSGGALDAAIIKAFKKKKPILTYYWEPTGLMGKLDLVKLKEPKFNPGCWNKMIKVVEDIKTNGLSAYKDTCACAYIDMSLTKAASKNFVDNPSNRAIVDFLKKYTLDTSEVNKQLAYYMWESGGNMKIVAKNFLRTSDVWHDWVPYEVAKNVGNSIGKTMLAKKEPTQTQQVVEVPQEEFKPKKLNKDTTPPTLEVAENMTADNSTYTISGKVSDKGSRKLYVEVDGILELVQKGKFSIKRFSPIDEEVKITAYDQWGNKTTKVVKVKIKIKDTSVAEKLEPLSPSKIKSINSNNKVALIIGIEKYAQSPKATYANLDAKYFYEYARKGFGINSKDIKLLVDDDASLVKSITALSKWLPSKVKNNQTNLIIFFAGHGLASSDGEELYLLLQDSDPDILSRTALSRTELFTELIKLKPKSVTMFLDTCYSGVSRDEQMLLASARPIRIVADDEGEIPDNFTIFSATGLDQISSGLKEAKHGIFSYYLMKGLEGKADSNKDEQITNGELLAYMDINVSQKALELGRRQNPSLVGDPDQVLMKY